MKSVFSAIPMLVSLAVFAAPQEAPPPEIPSLSVGYVLFLVMALIVIFGGFWWYYTRPEPKKDKSKAE